MQRTRITSEQLSKLGIDSAWVEPLSEVFEKFEINTVERKAAFIGQCAHESDNFKTLRENLNYSAEGLHRTWPKRFPKVDDGVPYQRNPEKIANKVYADRLGNGDERSGDGYRYCGRGLIQLTGKDNYKKAGEALGVNFLADPDMVATEKYAALTSGWFWKTHGLNELADKQDDIAITKRINGSTIGLDDRIARTKRAKAALTERQ